MSADASYSPWTAQEVEALNAFQRSGRFHPFTCSCEHGTLLEAQADGWHCLKCDYTQGWAHQSMLEVGRDVLAGMPSGDPFDDPAFLAHAEQASREAASEAADAAAVDALLAAREAEYRAAHPGGTCAECLHCEPFAGAKEHGACSLIVPSPHSRGALPMIDDPENVGGGVLVVPLTFGCNEHVAPCHECGGLGGDCDAGDDGRSVSWYCPACGGSGHESDTDWKSREVAP